MLYEILLQIKDFRRPQGKRFQLAPILYITIWALLSGATSYRQIHTFASERLPFFKKYLKLRWKKAPSYSTIREIITNVSVEELEDAFRVHVQMLLENTTGRFISMDGKTARGSFDRFEDKKAIHILMAMLTDEQLILGHANVTEEKTNEIPMLVKLLNELELKGKIVTADALHCQKKHSAR
jgi:hypothetical protein